MKAIIWLHLISLLFFNITGCTLLQPTDPFIPVHGLTASSLNRPINPGFSPIEADIIAGPLTLERAMEIALANNPTIISERWDVQAASARYEEASSQRWPTLSALGNFNYALDDQRLVPKTSPIDPGVFSDNAVAGDLVMKMPIFSGGRIIREIQAAELLQESAEHRLTRSRRELVFNISSVFYAILGQKHVIDSVRFSIKALEENRRQTIEKITVKKAAKVELLRTEVRLADLEQKLVSEMNLLTVQYRLLKNLMGIDQEAVSLTVKGNLEHGLDWKLESLPAYMEQAYAQRSDYLAEEAALEAQAKRVDVARAGHWPTVLLSGSYGTRWAPDPSVSPAGSDNPKDVGNVGITVYLPIFQGGAVDAGIREERARLAAAGENFRKLRLKIRLDVETAYLNSESNLKRVRATEKSIEKADESLRIERQKYNLGKGALIDVLDAQSALLEAQTTYYGALADFNTSISQLKLAVGEQPGVPK